MAECSICHDGRRLTRHGLQIHMGKVHDVHYGECLTVPTVPSNTQMPMTIKLDVMVPDLVPCGHPFCKVKLPRESLRAHWDSVHPSWMMHDGRYVWEYGIPDRGESHVVEADLSEPKDYLVPKSIEVR